MGEEEEHEHAEEWAEEGRSKLGPFVGGTFAEGKSGFSAGIDYEYRINHPLGIGATIEYTGPDFREWHIFVPLCWHPWKELKIIAAPGIEIHKEENEEKFTMRFGCEYGIGISKGFELAPAIYVDITEDTTALVIGAALLKSF
jgi:hypothetical protein